MINLNEIILLFLYITISLRVIGYSISCIDECKKSLFEYLSSYFEESK